MIYEKYKKSHIRVNYEYCVVGFGPSAVILVTQLIKMGVTRICVIESGSKKRNKNQDSLKSVETVNRSIKNNSRERIIGGATETWTGQYAVMDAIDFESRGSKVPDSIGWPINLTDLAPFYNTVSQDYGLVEYENFLNKDELCVDSDLYRLESEKGLEYKKFILDLPAQQFGKDYLYIFNRLGIDIFLNTTVVAINVDEAGKAVSVSARLNEQEQQIFAGLNIILASGAIENARLLLNSKNEQGKVLGNEHDQVGRYFMNRLKGMAGTIKLNKKIEIARESVFRFHKGRFEGYYGIRFSDNVQADKAFYNNYCMLLPWYPWYQSIEYLSVIGFIEVVYGDLMKLRINPNIKNFRTLFVSSIKVCINLCTNPRFWYFQLKKMLTDGTRTDLIQLRNFIEIQPHKDNRVTLSSKLDIMGVPIPVVDYDFRSGELKDMKQLHDEIECRLSQGRLVGQLNIDESAYQNISGDSSHHLGTTRMGDDPTKSVVNKNLQVHAVQSLYILGGSVFPSSGIANPTYTMMALSARLAKHLNDA
jgi:choline dehydrogenase-like flavoprotein